MFDVVTETWNPISGCTHDCVYCWARRLAQTRLRNTARYRGGFTPRLNVKEFNKRFRGGLVFVCDMGDIMGSAVRDEWILRVLEHIGRFPQARFLLLTKNPERYVDFIDVMPSNVVLGATIETDDDELYIKHSISKAPPPSARIRAMRKLDWSAKFISVEPILDFTPRFPVEIAFIKPSIVYVGYDNYMCRLPEPPLYKTIDLISSLEGRGIVVLTKTIRRAWFEEHRGR